MNTENTEDREDRVVYRNRECRGQSSSREWRIKRIDQFKKNSLQFIYPSCPNNIYYQRYKRFYGYSGE